MLLLKRTLKYLGRSGFPLRLSHALSGGRLLVLAYHRIRGASDNGLLAESLFGPNEQQFEQQVAWLAAHTRPLSEIELCEHLAGGKPLPKRAVLVTFDDGYRDQFELGAPILKRYRVPAIFFIPTASLNQRRVGWWDEIAWVLNHTSRGTINVAGHRYTLSQENRQEVIAALIARAKLTENGGQDSLLAELEDECQTARVPAVVAEASLMTWEQVQEAGRYGIAIGSHTASHCILSRLAPAAQKRELADSRAELERRTGREVWSVAYPFGEASHFTEITKSLAREAGFRLGFTLLPGVNRWADLDPFGLHRLIAPADLGSFALRLTFPMKNGHSRTAPSSEHAVPAYQTGIDRDDANPDLAGY